MIYYAEMCRIEKWNVRNLRKKISSMLYERTALSRKPEQVAQAELEQEKRPAFTKSCFSRPLCPRVPLKIF